MLRFLILTLAILLISAASAQEADAPQADIPQAALPFTVEPVATFNEPWAMTFLSDGRLLVTEKRGRLYVVDQDGKKSRPVEELPNVDYRGQGGLGEQAGGDHQGEQAELHPTHHHRASR